MHLAGTGMFLRRSVLEALGPWDEACLTEELEYSLRLAQLLRPASRCRNVRLVVSGEDARSKAGARSMGTLRIPYLSL